MAKFLILDTNSLPVGGGFSSGFWQALFRLCSIRGVQPAISEVTLHEAVNLLKESANEILDVFLSAHTKLNRMTPLAPVYAPTGEEIARAHEARLEFLFKVLPLEGDHAREALRREARRLVPAREGKGARDSAIWLTVAKLANDGHEVHFVTKNHKDFGAGGLLPELLEEIASAPSAVQYYESPNHFVDGIANRVDLPVLEPEHVATAFGASIRSDVVILLDDDESAEYTTSRAWGATLILENVRPGQAYEIDGRGLVRVEADVVLSDPTGVQWGRARMDGWLSFDPETMTLEESETDSLRNLAFR